MGNTCETVTLSVVGMAERSMISAVTAASCSWPCMPSSAAKYFFAPLTKVNFNFPYKAWAMMPTCNNNHQACC